MRRPAPRPRPNARRAQPGVGDVAPPAPLAGVGNRWSSGRGMYHPVPGARVNYHALAGGLADNSIVAVALGWIRDNLPQARAQVGRRDAKDKFVADAASPLARFLNARPNSRFTWTQTLGGTSDAYKVDGNAYWIKSRDGHGVVRGVTWVPNHTISVEVDDDGGVSAYWHSPGLAASQGVGRRLDPADVVHFRDGIDPIAPWMGLSRLKKAVRSIVGVNAGESYTAGILSNCGVASYLLVPKEGTVQESPEEDVIDADIRRLERETSGDRAGRISTLSLPMDVQRIGLGPEELALREVLDRPEAVISAILGVPALVTGLSSSDSTRTFSNLGESGRMAWENGIIPMQDALAETIASDLGPDFDLDVDGGDVLRWDRSGVVALQGQAKERAEKAEAAFTANLIPRGVACEEAGYPEPTTAELADAYANDPPKAETEADPAAGDQAGGDPDDPGDFGVDGHVDDLDVPDDLSDDEGDPADFGDAGHLDDLDLGDDDLGPGEAAEDRDEDRPGPGEADEEDADDEGRQRRAAKSYGDFGLTPAALRLAPSEFAWLRPSDLAELAGVDLPESLATKGAGALTRGRRGTLRLANRDGSASRVSTFRDEGRLSPSTLRGARPDWAEDLHPRDRAGHFIRKLGDDAHSILEGRQRRTTAALNRLRKSGINSGAVYDRALDRSIRLKRLTNLARSMRARDLVEARRAKAAARSAAKPEAPRPTPAIEAPKPAPAPKPVEAPAVVPASERGPGFIGEIPTSDIRFDPARFQYKQAITNHSTGSVGSLAGVRKWDKEMAGVVSVWRDHADGRTYVINGHNRLEKANELAVPSIAVRYIEARDAAEARAKGALANIAEGRGTSIDAAKFFRDTGIDDRGELVRRGIPLTESKTTEGLALAGLAPNLFRRAIDGTLPVDKGAILGGGGISHAQQAQIAGLYVRGKGQANAHVVKEWVDEARAAGSKRGGSASLFGDDDGDEQALFLHRTALNAHVAERLGREKRIFGTVSRRKTAAELEAGGNQIDAEASGRISREAAEAQAIFSQLKRTSVFSGLAADYTARMAAAKNDADRRRIKDAYYGEVKGRVKSAYDLSNGAEAA